MLTFVHIHIKMRKELLQFSESISREFDFGDEKSMSWLRLILRLFGW